jgi:hypothetical protein
MDFTVVAAALATPTFVTHHRQLTGFGLENAICFEGLDQTALYWTYPRASS